MSGYFMDGNYYPIARPNDSNLVPIDSRAERERVNGIVGSMGVYTANVFAAGLGADGGYIGGYMSSPLNGGYMAAQDLTNSLLAHDVYNYKDNGNSNDNGNNNSGNENVERCSCDSLPASAPVTTPAPAAPVAPAPTAPAAPDCNGKDKETKECKDKAAAATKPAVVTPAPVVAAAPTAPAAEKTAKDCDDKDIKLKERVSGVFTSTADADIKVKVGKDQWISKITKAVYGIGDDSEKAHKLYDAIAKINNIDNPKQWLTYDAKNPQEINLPKTIKINETEYQSACGKKDDELLADVEKNRTGGAKESPAEKQEKPEIPEKQEKPVKHTKHSRHSANAAKNPPAKKDSLVSDDLLKKAQTFKSLVDDPKYSIDSYAKGQNNSDKASKEWFFPTKMWHAFVTGVNTGDEAYHAGGGTPYINGIVDGGVQRGSKNPEVMDNAYNGMSDAASRNPGATQRLAATVTPAAMDEATKPENIEKAKKLVAPLLGVGLDELKKPENMRKLQPVLEVIVKDPKSQAIISDLAQKAVEAKSGQMASAVTQGLINDENALKNLYKGLAKAITKDEDPQLSEKIAELAFQKAIKTVNKPANFHQVRTYAQPLSDSLDLSSHFKPW